MRLKLPTLKPKARPKRQIHKRPELQVELKSLDLGNGQAIQVKVAHHAKARRVKLSIDRRCREARVAVPADLGLRFGWAFVKGKKAWLARHLTELEKAPGLQPGQKIPFDGGWISLVSHPDSIGIWLEDGQLHVGGPVQEFGAKVEGYFRLYAKKDLLPRVEAKAKKLGKTVNRVVIKDQRTRWGSCSSKGNLNFSWRIALAPDFVRDYLVAHEVAHLAEMNHGPRFWATADFLCPQGKPQRVAAEQWLKVQGRDIMALQTR